MAGISVALSGDNIKLTFDKGGQSTAVVMDSQAARALIKALSELLMAIGPSLEESDDDFGSIVDVTSPTIDVGTDEKGHAVVALQAGLLPPFMLRLTDDEARHIAQSLLEILSSPQDIRISLGDH